MLEARAASFGESAIGAGADPVVASLCLEQMAPWLGTRLTRADTLSVLRQLADTVRSVFLYRIEDGAVRLLDKPGWRVREDFNDSSEPEPEGRLIYREELIRARLYRDYFANVLQGSAGLDLLLGIDVNDAPISRAATPVLAFQKPAGANTVLLPDIDFLHGNFYIPRATHDAVAWGDKTARAIFAGSTTGGRTITAQDVAGLRMQRLRSGVYFKDVPEVDFRLPRIVQCESPEVAGMVRELGVPDQPCSWEEQFGHRFILSMDGNGATCSRVAIGLASRSALLKYDSPHRLFYFSALVPWRHFIPVSDDAEVAPIVRVEQRYPGSFAAIADEGRQFAQRYLGRAGTSAYMTGLLRLYQRCLFDGARRAGRDGEAASDPAPALQLAEFGAHIQHLGDVWGWPGAWVGEAGSGRAIEAVAVTVTGLLDAALECAVLLSDGTLGHCADETGFYGTRGQDRKLLGLRLGIAAEARDRFTCRLWTRFVCGTEIGPVSSGELCRSPHGAALEAFKVEIKVLAESSVATSTEDGSRDGA